MDRMIRNEADSMDTATGKLLYHILTSGYLEGVTLTNRVRAFLEAFPNDSVEIRKRLKEIKLDNEDVSPENSMDTATLYDKEGNPCMPRDLYLEITGKDPEEVKQNPVSLTKEVLSTVSLRNPTYSRTAFRQETGNQVYWS